MWRVVRAGYGTLDEIRTRWSLVELLEANIVISEIERAENEAHARAEKERAR